MSDYPSSAVYGSPPDAIIDVAPDARQVSPLQPGSAVFEDVAAGSLAGLSVLAPAGTVERRYVMALGLRVLTSDASLTILAPKDRGGARLRAELEDFGCVVHEEARRHHRICQTRRPLTPDGLDAALVDGGPRFLETLGLWTQPGVFSWDRIDPGSRLLAEHLPPLAGHGADFGCGLGVLAHAVLASAKVKTLTLIDIDRRAVSACRRNVEDPRVMLRWADVCRQDPTLTKLDFVVMNPPFHTGGAEDRSLGQAFIRRAAESLRAGGRLWITANRHLPYEAVMRTLFKEVVPVVEAGGYKVYEARK